MRWRTKAQAVLQSFFGLLTQPFEQSQEQSVRGAVTAIALSETFALVGEGDVLGTATNSLALVVVWMVVSAVFAKADRRKLEVARSIGVISFWIAATSALVLAAEQVYTDSLDRAPRLEFVWIGLFLLVPVHMFRSLGVLAALVMTLALWVSTGFLARALVY